jgi:acyl-coenzyme A synthetase/AMP-(fatty) acid ligase
MLKKTKASFYYHAELGRLYRTGDLGRWNKDGYIEFIGRKDSQVKLRGLRIELGEIENVLNSFKDIKQSLVIIKDYKTGVLENNSSRYLIAYYVSNKLIGEDLLIDYLHKHLPEYMIPSAFVHLSQLPLTVNGKVDRQALPDPELQSQATYVAPRNALGRGRLCVICRRIRFVGRASRDSR